jgi:hypothetical protein
MTASLFVIALITSPFWPMLSETAVQLTTNR